jgi:mitogen-activated protein kinase 8 interacting protein 3
MNNAQLSFHGYRDAVKFFVAVPGQPPSKILHDEETNSESLPSTSSASASSSHTTDTSALAFGDILVVSGGDGYIDFRIGDASAEKSDELTTNNRNMSYLIVWHLGSI